MNTTSVAPRYQTTKVQNLDIFYREAGDPGLPTLLLLHGFPSSSHMYRDLIADLSDAYHIIAPDYPGFGHSSAPSVNEFTYTFDKLAEVVEVFIDAIGLKRFSLFIQDYGAPVGFRIAARRPELIQALIIQNGNAYLEGIGPNMAAIPPFWKNRNAETEAPLRGLLTLDGTRFQYLDGVPDPALVSPDSYTYDQVFLDRPGNAEIQLSLLHDYQNNIPQIETWHKYLRDHQPPTLITWGKNDKFFTAKGAEAYLKDVPNAELHLLDTGHFALETHHAEIAGLIRTFLPRHLTA